MDIRSFFGAPSGGGGAAKPKAPASASKKSGQGRAASPASKKRASPAAAKKAGSNKGVGKMTLESNSKSKAASKKGKSSPPKADDDDDDDDDVVEVVPQPRGKSAAAGISSSGNNNISSSSSSSSNNNNTGGGGRRRAAKSAVNYKEDDDEDSGDDDGGGDYDDDDDDDFEDDSGSPAKPPKKRESASSPAAAAAAAATKHKSKKRVIVEEEEEEDDDDHDDDDEVQEVTPASSKHFSSSPPLPSSPAKRKAAAAAAAAGAAAAAAAEGKAKKTSLPSKKTPATVDLGGTSSDEPNDEDEKEEEEATPPPPKKKKPTPAGSSGGGGGGAGGFRPPWRGGSRIAPPNEGKKEVPVGKEQCLAGKTFVVSGVLDSLAREAAEDLIKQYGGKVTGSVSSKTAFLLLGFKLDDGRAPEEGSKYKKAKTLKTDIKIIDEDALFKMIKDSNPTGQSPEPAAASGGPDSSAPSSSSSSAATSKAVVNPYLPKKAVVNPYAASMAAATAAKKKQAPGGGAAVVNPYGAAVAAAGKAKSAGKSPARSSAGGGGAGSAAVSQKPGQMWVDKYKPTSSSGVIGHAGQVKKLKVWLQNWEGWHLKNAGAKPPTGKDNPGARAALLSGVPGVGKSSTATLVAREMGYHVMELNASDTRSKRSLSEELSSVIGNKVLSFGGGGGGSKTGGFRKQLVVMDEVDGMGGSDRGGIQELILLIKKSRVPIICICNDRQHQKIRSLANHCYDLRFSRPQKVTIAKRVQAVAKMEGMEVDDNAAEMLVEANGNDIRQVLHALQMWNRNSSKLTYMSLKRGISAIEKDKNQRIGPFDAARVILGGASRTPLRDRYELFFTDYSLLPLLVHQNYPSSLMNVDPKVRTDVTAAASAAVSDADIISGKMRGDVQHWELLPAQAALNVRVGSIGGGSLGFPEFPKWLGNYSRENKRRRLLGELSTHLNASVSGGTEAVRLSYLHFLKTVLTKPLRDEGADGAPACVALLEEYGLSRDDLFEVMPEFQLSTKGMKKPPPDVFASLDSKAKSAVTRCYNAQAHKSQALVEALQAPKKAKKRRAPPKSLSMEGEDADEEGGESSEDADDDDDVSAFKKKSRGAPANAKKGKPAAKPRAKKTKK